MNSNSVFEQAMQRNQKQTFAGGFFGDFLSNVSNNQARNNASSAPERRDNQVSNPARSDRQQSVQPTNNAGQNDINNERTVERPANEQQTQQSQQVTREEAESIANEVSGAERDALRTIADILGITAEQLAEILAILGLTVLDLTDKQNVDQLLLTVFNMERPSDLLNLPGIVGMFSDISEAAADFSKLVDSVDFDVLKAVLFDSETNLWQDAGTHLPLAADEAAVNLASNNKQLNEVVQAAALQTQPLEGEAEMTEEMAINVQSETQAANSGNQSQADTGQQQNPMMGNEQAASVMMYENKNAGASAATFEMTSSGIASKAEAMQSRPSVTASEIINQMIEKMKVDVRANVSEVRITLRPEALGDVSLKIITERGIVTAQFLAENERVKEIIESNFNILKDALEKQGVSISSLSVEVGSERGNQMREEFEKNRHLSAERIRQIMGVSDEAEVEIINDLEDNEVNYYA